jgi:2-polyprenyl-3-methyl-5-hydroxy-6-metoxy-1,4-benzoquinol methylase
MVQRRTGDTVAIPGSYQFDALQSKSAVQRFWHANKQATIDRFLPPEEGDRIADVGCGSGVIADYLARSGATVTGFDGNGDAVRFASGQFTRPNLAFVQTLVDEDFETDHAFTKIYCLELIEHVYEHQGEAMLRTFRRLLAPGGAVFLTTPNYRSAWPVIEWSMDTFGLAPRLADDQHVAKYHPARLRAVAERAGFVVRVMTTTCFLAPWCAPLSWRLAEGLNRVETGKRGVPGNIVVAVLEHG